MASSDSEEFASADEAASTDGSERRRRSKRTSSSNYDSEEGAAGRTEIPPARPVPELSTQQLPGMQVVATPDPPKPTDGWDDFDIEEEPTPAAEPTSSLTDTAVTPTDASAKRSTHSCALDIVKESVVNTHAKSTDDGWDQFDDWGQDNAISGKPGNVSEPSPPQEDERIKSVADRLSGLSAGGKEAGSGGGWGWGWGGSLLSTASAGITTLTSTVSQGISTVSNALESGIGAPEPEELAKRNLEVIDERNSAPTSTGTESAAGEVENRTPSNDGAFAFGNLMSGVSQITKFVENTGSKVITGGLDTLETIGKKTMEVLQEGDPGLAKKRAMLGLDAGDKPVLSHILREAKSKADEEDRLKEQKREAKEVHYETLFDDFEGLVHLEALEMLSRQVGMRLEERMRGLSADKRQEMKETLQQVAELCEMPEEEDEEDTDEEEATGPETLHNKLREATQDLGITLQFQPLVKQWEGVASWLDGGGGGGGAGVTERVVYKRAVGALAQCTALAVELYHRSAELLLVKARRSTADEADGLTQMTSALTRHVSRLATAFTDRLSQLSADTNKEEVNTYITNVFLEAGNSSTYIQNAFQLTLPILQIGAA